MRYGWSDGMDEELWQGLLPVRYVLVQTVFYFFSVSFYLSKPASCTARKRWMNRYKGVDRQARMSMHI